MNNSVYPKNHVTESKIIEKGKLKTTNFSGDELQETGKIKRKEDLGTRVGERPVRRACSVHDIRKIHSLHSSFLISQTTIVAFKINSSFIFFQNYYLTILKLLE